MLIFDYFPQEVQELLYEPVYKTTIEKVTINKDVNRKIIIFNIKGYGKNFQVLFSAPVSFPTLKPKEYQVLCFADKKQMYNFGQLKQKMFEYLCELSKEVKGDGRKST